jgi:hypothetical protein
VHTFDFNSVIELVEPNVQDPNPDNNTASTSLIVTAQADTADVTVTIERVTELGCHDNPNRDSRPNPADFFPIVKTDGEEFGGEGNSMTVHDGDIFPNWQFPKDVDINRGAIAVKIEIWDSNGGDSAPDQSDLDPDPGRGRDLAIAVVLAPCSVTGDIAGGCGTHLEQEGGERTSNSRIRLRVNATRP